MKRTSALDPPLAIKIVPADRGATLTQRLPWWRLGKYTGAGIVSGILNVALYHVLVSARYAPHVAWLVAFEVGWLCAFILHRNVTWRDRRVRTLLGLAQQLWRAQIGSLAALVLNLVVFTVMIRLGTPGEVGDAAGILAGFALNYALAHHFVYGRVRHSDGWHRSRRS